MKTQLFARPALLLATCLALCGSAQAGVVLSGGGLALVEEGGVIAPGNLAASGTALAKDLLPGFAAHSIPNLNDQTFGNGESWIGNSVDTFAGVSLGAAPVSISSIAFGRDNAGVFTDRTLGTYTLQYTTEANPTAATTAWTTIGTLDYQSAGGTNFTFPSKRHRYFFTPVAATGIRLLVPPGACIDELEAYPSIIVTNTADAGAGSLRQAVLDAAAASGPTHIAFAPGLAGQTITLGSEIVINDTAPVTIDASSLPAGITIDGGPGTNRIFSIPAGTIVSLNRLTLTGGGGTGASFSGRGGALYNDSSSLTLNHCSFQGNSADYGGGIFSSPFSSYTLVNCSFQGNSAIEGGGILNYTITGNTPPTPTTLTNCTFLGNSAVSGGGMCIAGGKVTLTNCSVQGNSATNGGGIFKYFNSSPATSPTLINCSIQGNSASETGGGTNGVGFISFQNSIIWNNKDNTGIGTPSSSCGATANSGVAISLIQGVNLLAGLDGTLSSNNPRFVSEVDPNLAPTTISSNLRLRLGSPAIDVGINDNGAGAINTTSTDLGGKPRFSDGNRDNIATIDFGAYENDGDRYMFVNAAVSGGTGDGTSWANAFPHLPSALAAAAAGVEIWIAAGTYYPDLGTGQTNDARTSTFALKDGIALYGGFAGTETLLSGRDPAARPTILSGDIDQNDTTTGNANNSYHVLTALGTTFATPLTAILDGFTITAGNANGSGSAFEQQGGGLYCIFASLTLNRCSVQGNSAGSGGGIFSSSSSPTLNHCSFQGNSAINSGGIFFSSSSSSTLTNCSFQGNSATNLGGGILLISSSPTLTNCSFQGNSATNSAGGIYNSNSSPILTNCSFQGNSAINFGGGILNYDSSSPTLNNCILWNNKDTSGTGTADSSVLNFAPSVTPSIDPSIPTYSHCLVQGYSKAQLDASGSSPDTNLEPSAPLFVRETVPGLSTTGGDLRLLTGSPAFNAGDNTKNSSTTDLAGNPRVQNSTIDLGAYEGAFVTFTHLGYTNPTGDANGNGITNFGDYAAGGNPTAPDDPTLRTTLLGDQLTFSYRDNAADITRQFQKSTTLLAGSWNPLVSPNDYTVTNTTSSGGRTLQTLSLQSTLLNSNPKLFFREQFTPLPPP